MKDLKGRKYATVAATRAGDNLQADGDFTCISADAILTVAEDELGLYVPCSDGRHHLDGQIVRNGTPHYMGLYPHP